MDRRAKKTKKKFLWLAGCFIVSSTVSACELIAGIEEKVAGNVAVPNDANNDDTAETGGDETSTQDVAVADVTSPPECLKHTDCVAKNGSNWICVKPENKCRSLLSPDCPTIIAGSRGAPEATKQEVLQDENTIFFGFIMDLQGSGKNAGIARRQAVELAAGDIHSITKGLPNGIGGKRRPIAFVACSETKDATAAPDPKVPARHLIDDLHVPAIIGASNSDTTIDLFNGEAFPKATLVFSPNALSSALSSPSDNGLFWRTSATSVLQGTAIKQQIGFVEDLLITNGATAGQLKLAFVYIGDAFGKDIYPHVVNGLTFNGAPFGAGANGPICTAIPCVNPTSKIFVKEYVANTPTAQILTLGDELNTFGPHIVVAIGRKDAVQISAALEAKNPTILPTHLYTQGSATVDVTTLLTPNPEKNGIRSRIRGGRPLAAPDEATIFVPLYDTAFPAGPPSGNGVPGCFDITYLLAYGAFAAPGDPAQLLTGARMNEGLKRVLDKTVPAAQVVKVGSSELTKGLDALGAGKNINVKGVSYTFDFDTNIGEAPGLVDIWCVAGTGNTLKKSGMIFDPNIDGGTTTGTFNCPAN